MKGMPPIACTAQAFNSRYNVSDPSNYGGTIDPVPVKYRRNHRLKAELT